MGSCRRARRPNSMSCAGSSPTCAAMIATYRCSPAPSDIDADLLALQVADGANGFVREQLEAPGMHTRERRDRQACIRGEKPPRPGKKMLKSISPRAISSSSRARHLHLHVADVGEALRAQQILADKPRAQRRSKDHGSAGPWSPPAAPRRRAMSGCQERPRRRLPTGRPENRGDFG